MDEKDKIKIGDTIEQMTADGKSEEDIQFVVDDFKASLESAKIQKVEASQAENDEMQPLRAKREKLFVAEDKPEEISTITGQPVKDMYSPTEPVAPTERPTETPSTLAALFPRIKKAHESGQFEDLNQVFPGITPGSINNLIKRYGPGVIDAFGNLLRVPGAIGRAMDEPDMGFTESLDQINRGMTPAKGGLEKPADLLRKIVYDPATAPSLMTGGALAPWVMKGGRLVRAAKVAAAGGAEGGTSAAVHQVENIAEGKDFNLTDAGIEIAASMALPPFLKGIGKGLRGIGPVARKTASELSGVSEEALKTYGTGLGKGAADIKAVAGTQREVGKKILGLLEDNFDDFVKPEKTVIKEALVKMPRMNVNKVINALKEAKTPAGIVLPNEAAANRHLNTYIRALSSKVGKVDAGNGKLLKSTPNLFRRGRKTGNWWSEDEDFVSSGFDASRGVNQRTFKDLNVFEDLGKGRPKLYDLATKEEIDILGKLSRSASDVQQEQKIYDNILKRNNKNAWAFLEEGENGKLAKTYYIRSDIAKKSAAEPSKPLNDISALEFSDLRKRLDKNIKWDEKGADLANKGLKQARAVMRNELEEGAVSTGNQNYVDAMSSFHDKLTKRDAMLEEIGSKATVRNRRIEAFVDNLFGRNKESKQEILSNLTDIFGHDFMKETRLIKMSKELGIRKVDDLDGGVTPTGPALLPTQTTGRSTLGAVGSTALMAGGTVREIMDQGTTNWPILLGGAILGSLGSPKVGSSLPNIIEGLAKYPAAAFDSPKVKEKLSELAGYMYESKFREGKKAMGDKAILKLLEVLPPSAKAALRTAFNEQAKQRNK